MFDVDIALEGLCALCNATVTSVQKSAPQARCSVDPCGAGVQPQQLIIKGFVSCVLDADDTSEVSKCGFKHIDCLLQGAELVSDFVSENVVDTVTEKNHIIDEEEFFAPEFDYDFTNLKDTETYWRGGEKYERPCGWYRFGLKVLNKYDENAWLGTRFRSTQSVPGEWPVSYHGTSRSGAEGIIEGYYKPGPGQRYGRGIYSTPDISEAIHYAKSFTSKKNGKKYKVILQNRINPQYREKHNNDKYWLIRIPKGTAEEKEEDMVERAIRPYGLLLKKVS